MSNPSKNPKFRWSEWRLVFLAEEPLILTMDKETAYWFKLFCSGYYQHNAL